MRNLIIAAGTTLAISAAANAGITDTQLTIDITGEESWDFFGDVDNTVLSFDLAAALGRPSGSPVIVTSIGWNVKIQTQGASWLSEATVALADSMGTYGLFVSPGAGNDAPGTGTFSSGGLIDLTDAGIPNIKLDDGILLMELAEGYDDVDGAIDAIYQAISQGQGSEIYIGVPTPGTAAILGVATIAGIRRRR